MASRETLLADTFLKLADTLIEDFDVIEVLSSLTGRCVELLDATATGILLADQRGTLQVMAASSETVNVLELFQVQNDEGPCLDAYRTAVPVFHTDLRETSRWPRFSALALESGFAAVHAFPMVVRADVVGTLNLFMVRAGALSEADATVAQALAHAATLTILQNQAAADSHRLTAQLQGALNSRITIEQAKGVISEVAGISTDEAFVWLRRFARGRNAKLTDMATSVVHRTLDGDARAELYDRGAADTRDRRGAPGRPPA